VTGGRDVRLFSRKFTASECREGGGDADCYLALSCFYDSQNAVAPGGATKKGQIQDQALLPRDFLPHSGDPNPAGLAGPPGARARPEEGTGYAVDPGVALKEGLLPAPSRRGPSTSDDFEDGFVRR